MRSLENFLFYLAICCFAIAIACGVEAYQKNKVPPKPPTGTRLVTQPFKMTGDAHSSGHGYYIRRKERHEP